VSKVLQTRRADNSAVLVLPNVRIWMEAQNSIYPLSLRDLLRESFTFIPIGNVMTVSILIILESFTIAIYMILKVIIIIITFLKG